MRRGLIAWSEDEVPRAALEARVARLQTAMADAGLGAVLLYTNFPRPSGVSWLTHFVPYWSQGTLAVFRDGPPLLIVSLSKRVAGWIEETSLVDEVICTPSPGKSAAELIRKRAPEASRIGVVELAKLPGGIGHPLKAGLEGVAIEDASALFAAVRHPADAPEIALSRRAAEIGRAALDGALPTAETADAVIAALDGRVRLAGAEDVIIAIAPDLDADRRFRRIEGDASLGARFAVRLSLAYKGHWVRLVRSFVRDGSDGDAALGDWLARGLAGLTAGAEPAAALRGALPGSDRFRLTGASAEACTGCVPLTVVERLPAGAVASVSLAIESVGGVILAGEPVLIAAAGGPPQRLCAG